MPVVQRNICIALACLMCMGNTLAQNKKPALPSENKHARIATRYSMLCPGLGQVYNKKYWKVPVIYGGFLTLGYLYMDNNSQYKDYKEAYLYAYNAAKGDTLDIVRAGVTSLVYKYTQDGLLQGKNYYKRNQDLSLILMGVLYMLNVIDASVDANLRDFDISDDISLTVGPGRSAYALFGRQPAMVSLSLSF